MGETKYFTKKRPEIIFLSFGLVGFLPKAPGTWGTLATLPFLYLLGGFHLPFFLFIPFLIILTVGSSFIANTIQNEFDLHDPGWIVIDEVIGMSVAWLFDPTNDLLSLAALFILFRFFDIIKIWPASYFDKKVTHGAGTILDDVVSGIYAGAIFIFIKNFLHLL
jgi:phosphatidylglycerophosphatase A